MRTLTAALFLISALAFAQEAPLKGPATNDPRQNASSPKTYQGCVIRSSGKIMLATPLNKDYILTSGEGRSLDSYVGQEVKITAANTDPNDSSSDERGMGSSEPQRQPPTLSVEDITKVSDHCSSPKQPATPGSH